MAKIDKTGYTVPSLDEFGNLVLSRVKNIQGETEKISPETMGYTKTLDLTVMFPRRWTSDRDGLEHELWFKQQLHLEFDAKGTKYAYFYFSPKEKMENVCVKYFAGDGYCFNISLSKPKDAESAGARVYSIVYGKPEKTEAVTVNKARIDRTALVFSSEALDGTDMGTEKL